jgi:hypothetical protein
MVATPAAHYRKAEELLAQAKRKVGLDGPGYSAELDIMAAAVHARLANVPPIVAQYAQDTEDAEHG